MATLNNEIVRNKLLEIQDHIVRIRSMDFTLEEINADRDIQDLISHRLHIAVESAIDIAVHIISSLGLYQSHESRDFFEELGRQKVISRELAENMGKACGLRNLIVHEYGKVDFGKLFYDYKDDLRDLEEYNKQIYGYLEKISKVKGQ
ncbi:MAG: hypothetical protein UT63_C0053G0010 [Candidatus Gottesmanbacteria bacterium GW2011_GWC2_39_8]|uniref:DUF86 domain-containing protein n=1 Tax=Candidatus Gottesmanbacteria bacterium GW2011_GWC2_39_8 TaxID=1618450 RepID=A0A0G0PV63_9BACT|nr:MAG: hypothetical protein UT63_C0053G0010 [Candidatus Gottesmanbacteria bacterium GW2011_GWC2_39_8]